ncbi:MAG TPA: transglutaminaseTgpA domain-containing protein, partial [Anaerolineales bacterium]
MTINGCDSRLSEVDQAPEWLGFDGLACSMYTQRMARTSKSALFQNTPAWDWPSAALVVLLLQVAAARLVMTSWTPFLYFTQTLAALGTALGLALAYSKYDRRAVIGLVIGYTALLVPWQFSGAVEAPVPSVAKIILVAGRLWYAFTDFFARRPVQDPILFVAVIGLGFWLMGLSAGFYFVRHGGYLAAVVPAGIVMLILQAYDYFVPVRIWALGVYVFLALLLLGRMYFSQNRALWDQRRVFVTFEARRDLMNSLVVAATIAVLAAWTLPTSLSNIQSAAQSWNRLTRPMRERFSNAVSALESPYGGNGRGDFYGDSLQLSRNASQGETLVLIVDAHDDERNPPPRYYWRGHIYNFYSNGRWSNTSARSSDFAPNADELTLPATALEREEVRFTMTLKLAEQGLLFAPAETFWINRPGSVLSTLTPDLGHDLAAWQAAPSLSSGDRYEVRALIANPTVEALRAAGSEYPDWVSARYLGVPEDVQSAVQPLAEALTANALT